MKLGKKKLAKQWKGIRPPRKNLNSIYATLYYANEKAAKSAHREVSEEYPDQPV